SRGPCVLHALWASGAASEKTVAVGAPTLDIPPTGTARKEIAETKHDRRDDSKREPLGRRCAGDILAGHRTSFGRRKPQLPIVVAPPTRDAVAWRAPAGMPHTDPGPGDGCHRQ